MRRPVRRAAALAAAAVLSLAGCGGSGDPGAAGETPAGGASASASPSPSGSPGEPESSSESPVEQEDDAVEIEVEIENGQVTPSGARVDAQVGQTVRFVVDSDAADELHVHSSPEHAFAFKAGVDDKEFEFKPTRPGVVEVELHELGDVVVTIAARP